MDLSSFYLIEESKDHLDSPSSLHLLAETFELETCQRRVRVGIGMVDLEAKAQIKFLKGPQAYAHLLRIACGLESRVIGETDVFGQIKEAWAAFYLESLSKQKTALAPIIQKLFEDTKEVRSEYLQNLGGASYGSLVRKLIHRHSTGGIENVLVVGAGQIARSVAPYLKEHPLWILNRTAKAAFSMAQELRDKSLSVHVVEPGNEARAWREASHVVIGVPACTPDFERQILLWKEGESRGGSRSVIHLGGYRRETMAWQEQIQNFYALDDVFDLQKSQDTERLRQIERARVACERKALLRNLSGHGWDDLAVFA